MRRDASSFAEYQEKATYGLGHILTLTRNSDNSVLYEENATNIGKIGTRSVEWFIPHQTASIPQQAILSKQILSKVPTEFQYVERSVFMKKLNTQNLWHFDLQTEEEILFPIWINIAFQQKDRQDSQNIKNGLHYRPPVTSAQCNIGTEKCSGSAILLS